MIKHFVMWKLKDEAEGASKVENIEKMRRLLEGCSALVPGIGRFEVGVAEAGYASTYDVVLHSEFDDTEALNGYLQHPQHQALVAFIRAVTEARQCVDYTA